MNAPMPLHAVGEDVTAPIMAQRTPAEAYRRAGDSGEAIRAAENSLALAARDNENALAAELNFVTAAHTREIGALGFLRLRFRRMN